MCFNLGLWYKLELGDWSFLKCQESLHFSVHQSLGERFERSKVLSSNPNLVSNSSKVCPLFTCKNVLIKSNVIDYEIFEHYAPLNG